MTHLPSRSPHHDLTSLLVKNPTGRRVLRRLGAQRAADILGDLTPLLSPAANIIDVGAGTCEVAALLAARGHSVTPVDVRDLSIADNVKLVLFDGAKLPFGDRTFEAGLLINVLHHLRDPDAMLREAKRVAKRVIVAEDVYQSTPQRFLTYAMDSALNLEFAGHPHSNRDDAGWRRTFEALGFRLVEAHYKTFWRFFSSATYLLES